MGRSLLRGYLRLSSRHLLSRHLFSRTGFFVALPAPGVSIQRLLAFAFEPSRNYVVTITARQSCTVIRAYPGLFFSPLLATALLPWLSPVCLYARAWLAISAF